MGSTLQEKMAAYGFESNDDYDFQIRCLLNSPQKGVKALNIEGDSNRRRTAFATALAKALEYPNLLYHDFTQQNPPLPDIILPPTKDEQGREEPPIEAFDQTMSEACAFSEGENTILILDQLQAADFREHIRIYRFLCDGKWAFRDAAYYANPRFLLVFLISKAPLFHSLQKASYRVWVNTISHRQIPYQPGDFGLDETARSVMESLSSLFELLDMAPTRSEYERLLFDIENHVRTADQLRHAIYAWTENVDRKLLFSNELNVQINAVIEAIPHFVGVDEVELQAPDLP